MSDDISGMFDWARNKIDEIDANAHGAKKKVVQELAQKLEDAKRKLDGIADEIVHELDGRVSKTLIYSTLDEKYKTKTKPSKNSKKIPHVESATDEEIPEYLKHKVVVTSDGHSAADEQSRIEHMPDQEDATEQWSQQAKKQEEQMLMMQKTQQQLSSMQFRIEQLESKLKPYQKVKVVNVKDQKLVFVVTSDPMNQDVDLELDEAESRRLSQ